MRRPKRRFSAPKGGNASEKKTDSESKSPTNNSPITSLNTDVIPNVSLTSATGSENKGKNQESAKDLKEKGNKHFKQKEYRKAVGCYLKAIDFKPDFKEAYYNQGVCFVRLKKFEWALSLFNKAIALDPIYASPVYQKAKLFLSKKKEDLALQTLDRYESHGGVHKTVLALRKECIIILVGDDATKTSSELMKKGKQYKTEGKLDLAKKYFKAVMAQDCKTPNVEALRELAKIDMLAWDGQSGISPIASLVNRTLWGTSDQEEHREFTQEAPEDLTQDSLTNKV